MMDLIRMQGSDVKPYLVPIIMVSPFYCLAGELYHCRKYSSTWKGQYAVLIGTAWLHFLAFECETVNCGSYQVPVEQNVDICRCVDDVSDVFGTTYCTVSTVVLCDQQHVTKMYTPMVYGVCAEPLDDIVSPKTIVMSQLTRWDPIWVEIKSELRSIATSQRQWTAFHFIVTFF